jgi:uncharacterized Tic20 family protein
MLVNVEIATTEHTSEERNWAIAAHLSALVAVMGVPFGHIIGPLIVYLVQRDRSPFVSLHAKASLNFQITVSIVALLLCVVAVVAWMGFIVALPQQLSMALPYWALGGWVAILCVMLLGAFGVIALVVAGAAAASKDRPYRYPFAISFVR